MRKPNVIVVVAALLVFAAGVARAGAPIETVVAFNPGAGQFPEGVAVDVTGNAYVSLISPVAQIRKIDRRGGAAALWFQSPLLAGNGSAGLGFPLGANGIAFGRNEVVVSNTEGAKLVRVVVLPDGSAGAASVVAQGAALFGADGVALDVFGHVFVAVNSQNTLLRVAPDGSITTLATAADGLDNPASLAFATSHG